LFACRVFSVPVSAPYSKILLTKAWYMSFLYLWTQIKAKYVVHCTKANTCDRISWPKVTLINSR
jgi:hypothetical protein